MNYQLSIEVEKDGKMQRCKTLVTEFGTKGMNITHDFSMPQPKEFKVGLFLENQFAPVTVKAKVVNQKKSSFGKYLIDLQFLNVLPIIEKKLSGFIDKAASGKLEKKVFTEIPLEVFNTTIKRYDETPENVDAFRG